MVDLNGFDATTVKPDTGSFEPVPKDNYLSMCIDTERKENSKKTGHYLQLTFEILEGEYKGRRLLEFLNLWHPNDTTMKIAQGKLSAICHAVGIMTPKESSEFHNKPVILDVDVEERNDKPGTYNNRIKSYLPPGEEKKKGTTKTTAAKEPEQTKAPWAR